jgi:hypothetical protein
MTAWRIRCAREFAALTLLLLAQACGGSPSAPSPPNSGGPVVASISPNSGPSIGGTLVTITGQRFDATATVAIGGVAATKITFVSANTLTAVTGSRTIGAADVVVTVAGRQGVLANGFRYTASSAVTNPPPVISSLNAVGTARTNEPAGFAEANEEIAVTAVVTDAETPDTELVFEWTADAGTVSGTGTSVKWKAPSLFGAPVTAKLTLTVIERYTGADSAGNPVASENRVSAITSVSVHDSIKENGDMATAFLTDFADSSVSPEAAVRYFYTGCPGRQTELKDIQNNRANYIITGHKLGSPSVTISFGDVCAFESRSGDACISMSCEFKSTILSTGGTGTARGTCYLASVYRDRKWQLCDSNFQAEPGTTAAMSHFMR